MKKGFTMIELIFVIVILGILAAVAVPRLTATRDDAEVAKAATNLTTLVSDISAYYTSQAEFADSLAAMTNVQISDAAGSKQNGLTGNLLAAGKKCLAIKLSQAATDGKPATLKVEKGSDNATDICKKILANKGVADMLKAQFKYNKATTNGSTTTYTETSSDEGEIAISGLGIKF